MADWSRVPDDLLRLIAKRLHSIEDYACFGAVCRSWHMVTLQKDCSSDSKVPWLMLTQAEPNDKCSFYCPSTEKVYEIPLPEIHGRRCWGSSCGWLVTVGTDMNIYLLNPLSRAQILLPPLQNCSNLNKLVCHPRIFRDSYINKVIVHSSPSSSDCVVMAIFAEFERLAFTKPHDEAWIPMESHAGPFDDIIYLNGNFLAVNPKGHVAIHDSTGIHMKTLIFTPSSPVDELLYEAKYLVELKEGEICMVIRRLFETGITEPSHIKTWGFEVYELDFHSKECTEIKSLNHESLFLGNNYSFSVHYPECRKNCVYFNDDYIGMGNTSAPSSYDMGIYRFEDRKIEPYPVGYDTVSTVTPPLWIKPSFF